MAFHTREEVMAVEQLGCLEGSCSIFGPLGRSRYSLFFTGSSLSGPCLNAVSDSSLAIRRKLQQPSQIPFLRRNFTSPSIWPGYLLKKGREVSTLTASFHFVLCRLWHINVVGTKAPLPTRQQRAGLQGCTSPGLVPVVQPQHGSQSSSQCVCLRGLALPRSAKSSQFFYFLQ